MVFSTALRQASSSVNSVGMQKACPLSCLICSTRSLATRGCGPQSKQSLLPLRKNGRWLPRFPSLRPLRAQPSLRGQDSCGSDDFLGGRAELVDAKLDQVPFLQIGFRIHAHAHARRGPRRNDAARKQGHELTDVTQQERNLEVKVGRVARLSGFPVDLEPHVQVVRVFDLVRSREKGTERSKGIATFSFTHCPQCSS